MKRINQFLLLLGLGLVSGLSGAATGYVEDSGKTIVRTGYGDCLHTTRWSETTAIAECDPEIVAARDAAENKTVEVAAVEVVIRKELKPVRLQADALFGFDSAALTANGKAALDDMLGELDVDVLKDQKIQITGYTDRIGPDSYNLELSRDRAAAVRDYLISKGLVPSYIDTTGMGAANPVVDCKDQRGPALVDCLAPNRRTEIEFSAMEVIEVQETVPAGSR